MTLLTKKDLPATTKLQSNVPNAGRVISALRHLGYNNIMALCDLTDNSIDGNASKISLTIKKDGDTLLFRLVDNGEGMNKEELDQALRLGSITKRNPTKDLGLYGMGLVTASISMAQSVYVLTRKTGSLVYYSKFDVDQAIKLDTFDNERGEASESDIKLFNQLVGSGSGTIITLSRCDKLQYKNVDTYENKMFKEYGRVYRYLLGSPNRIEITVNDRRVEPIDPLMLKEPGFEEFMDKSITYTSKLTGKTHSLRVRLVKLPDYGQAGNRERKINPVNQGFYVMRNFREIAKGETLGIFNKHPHLNRFRAEIIVNGELDDELGVNFTKRNLALNQALRNKLEQLISPQIETIQSQLKKKQTKEDAKVIDHNNSAKKIEDKFKLLIGPKQVEVFEDIETVRDLTYEDLNVSFTKEQLGNQGQIYEAEHRPDGILIKWNLDHPFYERFVVDNRDNKDMVDAADFLIYSMAHAELSYREGSSQRDMFVTLKTLISSNMRQLLS